MSQPAFPELSLSWDGAPYRCRPTFDVLAQIEQKVALQKLAYTVIFDRDNVPMTHIAWVMFCLLQGAGAPVTPDAVWRGVRDSSVTQDQLAEVMRFVIQETYGVSAEANEESQPSGKPQGGGGKKRNRKRRRRSSSGTSTQSQ